MYTVLFYNVLKITINRLNSILFLQETYRTEMRLNLKYKYVWNRYLLVRCTKRNL